MNKYDSDFLKISNYEKSLLIFLLIHPDFYKIKGFMNSIILKKALNLKIFHQ
ncbi:MAG: hypothetical protein Ct9H90mP6_04800 [Gammaproteobacteria bacterium]|nr:MAG: hypothetical protein Ct9H90mP6_04800 [Gammaproteobacteria bacterium]